MSHLALVLLHALRLLQLAVLARVILSWIDPFPRHPVVRKFTGFIDALARPFKVVIPMGPGMGLDLGPLFLLLVIEAVQQLVARLALLLVLG
ncbi:MAG: YggT family protein [Candidatus Riflebacteria bacterium]|nr:YggT family protein [Candidatus Riflebacteria bacterium]